MSVQTLECVALKLRPGLNASTGEAKAVFDECIAIITAEAGCNAVYHGTEIEDPQILHMIVDWQGIDAHKAFMASPNYKPFLGKVASILAAPPAPFHITIPSTQPISRALSAPVTEVMSVYFEPTYDRTVFDAAFAKLTDALKEVGVDTSLSASGWGVEEHRHQALAAEGETDGPAAYYGAFIGWDSVEQHKETVKKDAVAKLGLSIKGESKAMEYYHASFKKA